MIIRAAEIIALMDRERWTQSDLAQKCGVSQGTISRWLKGTVPDPASQAILRALIDDKLSPALSAPLHPNEAPDLKRVYGLVLESYLYIGLERDEADELLALVREAASAPQQKRSNGDAEDYQRLLADAAMNKVLKSKRSQSQKP
jgi:transcriptional regulator with XRE-family HTH domain